MFLLFSLVPATVLAALGYVILYCSTKAEGPLKAFGQVLTVLLFVLAAVPLLVGGYFTVAGISPGDMMAQHMSSYRK